jgi:hypothetical protein
MGFTEPDSAPQPPGQMPAAPGAGPAPVPYGGADQSPQVYDPPVPAEPSPGDEVMNGVSGNAVQEAAYAHDMNAGLVTPYYGGDTSPIQAHGDADAGGRDDVAATVAAAVTNAEARYHEFAADATVAGPSQIGDAMTLTPVDSDASVGPWGPFTDQQPPSGSFT